MSDRNFLNNNVIEVGSNLIAGTTGTSYLTGVIDAQGFDRVTGVLVISSTQAASGLIAFDHLHSSLSTAGFVATTAALTAINAPGKALAIEIIEPLKRYQKFRALPSGTGSSPAGGIIVIKGRGGQQPVAQSTVHLADSVTVVNASS